ncbi:SCO7613 C-terminal domain-containing membrane protein [Cellulomonas sp. URHE0023]|uniref:SCO7613 C-terminal domain-containing membrane protein n=1 Tax=Cellulomonas sp. URHE0023 TaxID=1380354 RepID=UPI000489E7CD|nr:hypothetical protein [Cellulomonas sp. URHE0023]
MTDPEIHLTPALAHARRLLLDARLCPGCDSTIAGPTCGTCRLELSGDRGARLWRSSLDAVAALEARAVLVADLRAAQAVSAPRAATVVPTPPDRPTPVSLPAFAAAQPAHAAGVPVPRPPARPFSGPPRTSAPPSAPWRVQTVLQVLGVALLAMASLVFLVFSWDVMNVSQRGAVIGLGTVVVLVLAVWLNRRGLGASAQAVGVLGSVLVVLDAWAVYAIGVLPDVDPAAYAAVACLVCATGLAAYGWATGIRSGTVGASLLLPLAPVMVLVHAQSAAQGGVILLTATVLATVRFVPALTPLRAERTLLCVAATSGVVTGWIAALIGVASDGEAWPPIGVLGAAAVLAVLQAVLAARAAGSAGRPARAGRAWAAAAGIAAVSAATAASVELDLAGTALPALLAVALVAALPRWPVTRPGRGLLRACADGATIATLAVGAPSVVLALTAGTDVVAGLDGLDRSAAVEQVVGSAALVLMLVADAMWRGGRAAAAARHASAVLTIEVVLVSAALVGAERATITLLAAGVVATVVGLLRIGWLRWYVRAGAALGVAGALAASLGEPWWTGLALAACAAFALSARWWTDADPARASSTFATAVLAWAAVAQLLFAGDVAAPVIVAAAVAVAVLTTTALGLARSDGDRHAALAVAALVGAGCWVTGVSPTPAVVGPTVVLGAVVAAAVLAVAVWGQGRLVGPVVVVATAAVAPVTALALVTAQALTGQPPVVVACLLTVVIGGAAAVAAGALPPTVADRRIPVEAVGWLVVAAGILASGAQGVSTAALGLVLASVVAAACAARRDRRVELWVALGLLVAASWCALVIRDVGVPEAYLAPLGVVLVGVGLVRWRSGGAAAAELLGCGLALATVPTSVIADPLVVGALALDRAVLATASSAVLVLAASLVVRRGHAPPTVGHDPVLALAAVGGALALLGPARRAVMITVESWTEPQGSVELWALPAAMLLAGACTTWLLARPGRDAHLRRAAPWAVLALATVPALLTHDEGPAGLVRICVGALLGTYLAGRGAAGRAVLPGVRWSPPADDVLGMGAMVLVASAVAALSRTWAVPHDAVLVVLGLIVLLVGGVRMRTRPATATWLAFGPGLALALGVPTLTALATGTTWRVGVVIAGGILAVVVGAVRRWQAPFVVGSLALLVQLVVQLAPVTREAIGGLGWWPVLALGGAALLGLGLTYERRLRDAKEAVRYVGQMS